MGKQVETGEGAREWWEGKETKAAGRSAFILWVWISPCPLGIATPSHLTPLCGVHRVGFSFKKLDVG